MAINLDLEMKRQIGFDMLIIVVDFRHEFNKGNMETERWNIGRKLWDFLRENSSSKTITVNSSPYAVPVYHKLGFVDTDTEQLSDGMRYIPMKFEK